MSITATLIGQMVTFAVLVWFVMRFLWEPMTSMMAERTTRIADGLAAAERGKHEQQLAEPSPSKTHLCFDFQARPPLTNFVTFPRLGHNSPVL